MPVPVPIPIPAWEHRPSDDSISPRTRQPIQQIATGCHSPRQGTFKCDPKKRGALPCCVRHVSTKRARKASTATSRGVYAVASAVILKKALHLHSTCKVQASRRLTLGYDIVSLLLSACILFSSFSLSLFTVTLLQLNAPSKMGIGQGDEAFPATILMDTQVGVTILLLSLYLFVAVHYWLMWERARGPHGMTRALSAGAAIGILMLRVIHADPLLADFNYLQHAAARSNYMYSR